MPDAPCTTTATIKMETAPQALPATVPTAATPTVMTRMDFITRLLLKVTSWSRCSSAVCLVVACIQEFRDKDLGHITLWLLAGLGVYSAGKVLTPAGGDK